MAKATKKARGRGRETQGVRRPRLRYGGSQSQINKMKMKAKQADKVQEQIDADADEAQDLLEDQELPLELQCGGHIPGNLIALKDVGFHYPNGEWLFRNAELGVDGKSRIVFLGENGNGKTTLVKLLTGSLEPVEGECKRSPGVRISLVNQHHADQLDLRKTPLQFMLDKFPGNGSNEHELKLRSHLAKCGVTGGRAGPPEHSGRGIIWRATKSSSIGCCQLHGAARASDGRADEQLGPGERRRARGMCARVQGRRRRRVARPVLRQRRL